VASGGIYLRQGDQLVQMVEQPYATEDILQALLADHPDLLAGDQSDGDPRRWLLLAREAPLGDADHDSRWSVDHLFVDQDAIPTIVEVKRSSDTRIRREVVGQMLEYAANAVSYWRSDDLRARFEATARQNGAAPEDLLSSVLAGDDEPEHFWERLRTNLAASRVRLVFVADDIPPELRHLVEFLNEQMQSAEVLAVEVKQYVDADGQHQTLVPRLVGHTERARLAKGNVANGRWDRERLLKALEASEGEKAADIVRRILDWAHERHLRLWFGRGQHTGSVVPGIDEGMRCYPFTLYTYGKIEIQFQPLSKRSPFDHDDVREELRARLNQIPGVSLPEQNVPRRPSFALSALESQLALETFLKTMDWTFERFREAMD
jgi:hypothetical protein